VSYGHLSRAMLPIVRQHVRGQVVWDLGCGDLGWARKLLSLGASRVVGIDKEPWTYGDDERLEVRRQLFIEVEIPDEGIDLAFVSWPANYVLHGLLDILKASRKVIYLGSNLGGSACAWTDFFDYILTRELLDHTPNVRNSLLVLGDHLPEGERRQLLTPEEIGAGAHILMSYPHAVDMSNWLADVVSPPSGADV